AEERASVPGCELVRRVPEQRPGCTARRKITIGPRADGRRRVGAGEPGRESREVLLEVRAVVVRVRLHIAGRQTLEVAKAARRTSNGFLREVRKPLVQPV